ncbi:MAG TPA: ABC transporter permease [Clostridiales bacterium]|nr:ABC transporter permease [Clostridiales bacterium]
MKSILKFKKTSYQQLVIVGVLLLIMAILSLASPEFLTTVNLINVLRQIVSVVIAGCAVTLLMISGNFDLSIGSTMALAGTMTAIFVTQGIPLPAAILMSVLIGMVIGLINGVFVIMLNVPSIIATLGTMYIMKGIAWVTTGGNSIHLGLGQDYTFLGRGFLGPFPLSILIAIFTFLVFYFIQSRTLLGKYTYAIGANRRTALLSGINVYFYGVILYVLVGLLSAFSGVIMSSRLGVGSASIGVGFEFDVIVAVVLGGTSLNGGEGSVLGTITGALIVGFIANGLNLMGIHSFYQDIVKGIVLVGAVLLDLTLKSKLSKT